jgi:hypothetical protein
MSAIENCGGRAPKRIESESRYGSGSSISSESGSGSESGSRVLMIKNGKNTAEH